MTAVLCAAGSTVSRLTVRHSVLHESLLADALWVKQGSAASS